MSEQQIPIDPDLIEFEASLCGLTPSPSRLDRDRLMFQSGRSVTRPWVWPSISAGFTVISLVMGAALIWRPEPRVIETIVYIKEPPQEPTPVVILSQSSPPPVPRSIVLDRRLLRYGPESLPDPPRVFSSEFTALDKTSHESGSMLRSELARLLNPGESL